MATNTTKDSAAESSSINYQTTNTGISNCSRKSMMTLSQGMALVPSSKADENAAILYQSYKPNMLETEPNYGMTTGSFTLTKFHPFPNLPFELRRMIWELSVTPRLVILTPTSEVDVLETWDPTPEDPEISNPEPVLLDVCAESKRLVLGIYQQSSWLSLFSAGRYQYVNLDVDVLVINIPAPTIFVFPSLAYGGAVLKFKNIAMSRPVWEMISNDIHWLQSRILFQLGTSEQLRSVVIFDEDITLEAGTNLEIMEGDPLEYKGSFPNPLKESVELWNEGRARELEGSAKCKYNGVEPKSGRLVGVNKM